MPRPIPPGASAHYRAAHQPQAFEKPGHVAPEVGAARLKAAVMAQPGGTMPEKRAPFQQALGITDKSFRDKIIADPTRSLTPAQVARLRAAGLDPHGNLAPFEAGFSTREANKARLQAKHDAETHTAVPDEAGSSEANRPRSIFSPGPEPLGFLEKHALHQEKMRTEQANRMPEPPDLTANSVPPNPSRTRSLFTPEPDSHDFLGGHARHWERLGGAGSG